MLNSTSHSLRYLNLVFVLHCETRCRMRNLFQARMDVLSMAVGPFSFDLNQSRSKPRPVDQSFRREELFPSQCPPLYSSLRPWVLVWTTFSTVLLHNFLFLFESTQRQLDLPELGGIWGQAPGERWGTASGALQTLHQKQPWPFFEGVWSFNPNQNGLQLLVKNE